MDKASELTANDIEDRVLATGSLAHESGQYNAALKAWELLGKERGLYKDRRESITVNLASMSIAQVTEYLQDRYGDKAQSFIDWIKQNYSAVNSNTIERIESSPVVGPPMYDTVQSDD